MILRMSELFLRTLRDDPADADLMGHKFLVRAGYIRRVASGIYSWLPLGLRVLDNIIDIVKEEMERVGAQQVHFPALLPREPYEVTGRWDEYGENLFRLQDRRSLDYLLAPTHEEMFTLMVKDLYSSYKDLPVVLYQVQTKYRDEARSRGGLLRGREFVMKDAYSFDVDELGLEVSYQLQREAYLKIFSRLGLDVVVVSAVSGAMGGSKSEEFLLPTEVGEDKFVVSSGGYAANVEAVETWVPESRSFADLPGFEVFVVEDVVGEADLVAVLNGRVGEGFFSVSDVLKVQGLVFVDDLGVRNPIVLAIPADRGIDYKRLEAFLKVSGESIFLPTLDDLEKYPVLVSGFEDSVFGGFVGKDLGVKFWVDPRVVSGSSWIVAGEDVGSYLVGVVAGRDFVWDGVVEAAEVLSGDLAPDGSGVLEVMRGMEMGHIFQLGTKYSELLDLRVLDALGKSSVVHMGSYGIGVTRALAAIAEISVDDKGLCWPVEIAPAKVHLVVVSKGEDVYDFVDVLAGRLSGAGVSVLYDDRRKVSAGVKFRDAELLGVPKIVVFGKGFSDGVVELRDRVTGVSVEVFVGEVFDFLLGVFGRL